MKEPMTRVEAALNAALSQGDRLGCPPRLASAMRYAVFPGGARIRPRLCIAVAHACGDNDPAASIAAATAIELLHCASLVHDDLPCFDDAAMRRGKPSVHKAYGEALAVLAGDALIVMAFQTLARGVTSSPHRLAGLLLTVGRSVGVPTGIVAGQAWECEPIVDIVEYQREKTGSLFVAATVAGAEAAGADPAPWRTLGERLGEAYQAADDIRDVAADPSEIGKPVGQDETFGRPNVAHSLGLAGALAHLDRLVEEGIDSIPPCRGAADLKGLILVETKRFLPKELQRAAA